MKKNLKANTGTLTKKGRGKTQEITAYDCVREGISTIDILEKTPDNDFDAYAKKAYSSLWDSLNAKRGHPYTYSSNPWVWVIEFKRISSGVT